MAIKTAKQYQDIIDKNDGVTFHSLEMKRLKNDPKNQAYQAAENYAKNSTERFMNQVRDYKQPGHEIALEKYLNTYEQNENNVYADALQSTCILLDAAPVEWKNLSIENKLVNKHIVRTADDDAFIQKFKALLNLKIDAEGYKDMDQFTTDFWEKHPLSK